MMGHKTDNKMTECKHGYAVITYLFKHGGEAAHIITFGSNGEFERFAFDKWFMDRMMHEGGMFPHNGYERISIDMIARIHCETFDKEWY